VNGCNFRLIATLSQYGSYEDGPFLAEYYDFIPGYAGRPDLNFYLDYARRAGGTILELGCGTGRVLIPIATAGCRSVGLDLSSHMLAKCKEKLLRQPKEVQQRVLLFQGNMIDFKLDKSFSLVTTPFRPFQHLVSVEEQTACLRRVNQHLARDGKLILDLFHPDPGKLVGPVTQEETEDVSGVSLPDGRILRRTFRITGFHRAEQYNEVELIYYVTHPDGRTKRFVQAFPMRYFYRYEIEHLLARTGFRVVELFGDYDQSPLTNDSPEMIFVAERVEEA
jgi:SAM-dependent methyltransferase